MPKFEVTIYRTVQDSLRSFVTVEADDEIDSIQKVRALNELPEFEFWQCGDSVGEDDYEVNGIYFPGKDVNRQ